MSRKKKQLARETGVVLAFAPEWAKVRGVNDTNTTLLLQLRACRNPVPAAAMALDTLSERVPVSDDDYRAVLEDVAVRTVWAENDCDRYVEASDILPRFRIIDWAQRIFCTALLARMRHAGSDIPVQEWEEMEQQTGTRTAIGAARTTQSIKESER
ncbi:MAG: hypothetical protein JXA74_17655 [Anaerolineae bacterium]|nr:hypothetical protein [Anaerolineae bacterium]